MNQSIICMNNKPMSDDWSSPTLTLFSLFAFPKIPKEGKFPILKSNTEKSKTFSLTNLDPMDEPDSDPGSYPTPPASVHLASFSSLTPPPSARLLLSRHVTRRTRPLQSSPPLAYLSLQGLLDEASSARSIGGGGLSREEALAWELFTPYQRFLIVAVIGVAAAESKKNDVIAQLQNSVDLRVRYRSFISLN